MHSLSIYILALDLFQVKTDVIQTHDLAKSAKSGGIRTGLNWEEGRDLWEAPPLPKGSPSENVMVCLGLTGARRGGRLGLRALRRY